MTLLGKILCQRTKCLAGGFALLNSSSPWPSFCRQTPLQITGILVAAFPKLPPPAQPPEPRPLPLASMAVASSRNGDSLRKHRGTSRPTHFKADRKNPAGQGKQREKLTIAQGLCKALQRKYQHNYYQTPGTLCHQKPTDLKTIVQAQAEGRRPDFLGRGGAGGSPGGGGAVGAVGWSTLSRVARWPGAPRRRPKIAAA